MKKFISACFILIVLLCSCKKDTSSTAHLYPIGTKVRWYDLFPQNQIPPPEPLTIKSVEIPAEKRECNYYVVEDANGQPYHPIADYNLRPY